MLYREFDNEKISLYGMGLMRLPLLGDGTDNGAVDESAVQKMVDAAFDAGVNYFDTAWGYHNGNSQEVIGRCLAKYPRDSFNLAQKFPGYDRSNWGKHEEIFAAQLEKCQVSYFDFYLVHNVCEMNIDAYLDEQCEYGDVAYLQQMRDEGKIRHLGFSIHGTYEIMKRFLEKYGSIMEFVQIQLNYVDYTFQDAKAKLELAREYDLPVIVMEPLRGGMLATASEEEMEKLDAQRPGLSIIGWAMRYLQSFDQVLCILNGASNIEQELENLAFYADENPLSDDDKRVLQRIVDKRIDKGVEPCTACHYCTEYCPQGIDIPEMLRAYNEHKFSGGSFYAPMFLSTIPEGKRPWDCQDCGECMDACPQAIDIPAVLADFSKMMGEK